ncbi:MAG: hydrolase [Planctomycetota bacterium]|nr:hydrolase [Planctomycetota bacterium]
MLEIDNTVLVVIDVQGKLAQSMHEKADLFENVAKLIKAVGILEIPIIWTEQYPEGLGPTIPQISELMTGEPIAKVAFSCCGERRFTEEMERLNRRQVLLCGIETHVCVYQTAVDLLESGHEVHVAADAVSSRTAANKDIGLAKMKDAGAAVTSVETALFELLKVAKGEKFKAVINIVK